MKYKQCSKCKKELLATDCFFYKKKGGKFGLCSECKVCMKRYQKNNRNKCSLYNKQYYKDNREQILNQSKQYYRDNKYKRSVYYKQYVQTDKGRVVYERKMNKYRKENKLSRAISNSIRISLKSNKAGRHWEDLVGYTLEQLKHHLENLFQPGMAWCNYGFRGWHIDHIKPISSFCKNKLSDVNSEEFKVCWSLTNLQPLWWGDNLSKGNKYE